MCFSNHYVAIDSAQPNVHTLFKIHRDLIFNLQLNTKYAFSHVGYSNRNPVQGCPCNPEVFPGSVMDPQLGCG